MRHSTSRLHLVLGIGIGIGGESGSSGHMTPGAEGSLHGRFD